ncbi:Sugar phosphate isomerase/epimerase [Kaistia soli DSM 19436]|uniref:Sugar phosphate isomerase/epimerase n=1 Tax=Kaistia soli DSM 19436 TaxID=1122133 RepID=A0A1M4WLY4_9HYPH|nr:TIM barrel protein [Kaistia soli]SHE82238.1 Sugar phosphate isomerase/epimerase [Kaistia soli DSM 19436]
MTDIKLAVFTKPWNDAIEAVADRMAALGVEAIELPIRPGYQVTPETVATSLPEVVRVLASRGLSICSVAAPLDEAIIRACGDNGIDLVRTMVGVDLGKARFADTIRQSRATYEALIPLLDETGVRIGVQNHSGNCIGSAIGLYHLMEPFDPKHVCAILDMAHCAVAGEPTELSVDLLWERMPNLVNFKNAYRERINGPEEAEAVFRTHWTTGRHGGYSWSGLVQDLHRRGFTGTFVLPGEYTDPKGEPQRMGDDVLPFLSTDVAYLRGLVDAAWAR